MCPSFRTTSVVKILRQTKVKWLLTSLWLMWSCKVFVTDLVSSVDQPPLVKAECFPAKVTKSLGCKRLSYQCAKCPEWHRPQSKTTSRASQANPNSSMLRLPTSTWPASTSARGSSVCTKESPWQKSPDLSLACPRVSIWQPATMATRIGQPLAWQQALTRVDNLKITSEIFVLKVNRLSNRSTPKRTKMS